jgi:hypothetical protein
MWPAHLTIPSHYQYSEAVTGVLPSSPYLWLALMPVVMLIPQGWRWLRREKQDKLFDRMTWLEVGLVGIALLESALMLLYTYSSMRYLNDWLPTLYLVAALGMWRWDELNQFHLVQQRLLRWAVGILALVSLVISLGLNLANILK